MVQDFGTGISPESLPHVFDRFFREDSSRSRETGGAGLGLSICKAIVEKAGGSIEIESEKGKGTIVKVRLPHTGASDESNLLQE
jgi:signal transduction histidine kinase